MNDRVEKLFIILMAIGVAIVMLIGVAQNNDVIILTGGIGMIAISVYSMIAGDRNI